MERIFTIDFIAMLALVGAAMAFAYWRDRVLDRKLGKIHAVMIRNKYKKFYQYRHLFLIGQITIATLALWSLHVLFLDNESHSNPLTVPLIILLPQILARFRPLTFGENGVVLGDNMFSFGRAGQFIPWKKIRAVEWDRDLGQIGWGFKIYFKKGAAPFKASVEREYQPQADELFKKVFKN